MTRYAVIDFETTGLNPHYGDRPIEIGIVLVENESVVDSYASLMNPGQPISPFITSFTGISNDMVKRAPRVDAVMKEALRFVGSARLVAHNASFDRKFWISEAARVGRAGEAPFLCTMLLARRLYPWAPNHQLGTLAKLHRIIAKGRHHRALADAGMTADLLTTMLHDLRRLYRGELVSESFLEKYQRIKKALAKSVPAPLTS
jgi:DNA polymerase III subunit epsilon